MQNWQLLQHYSNTHFLSIDLSIPEAVHQDLLKSVHKKLYVLGTSGCISIDSIVCAPDLPDFRSGCVSGGLAKFVASWC